MSDDPTILQHGYCTLCAPTETSGFYTGCMIRDGACPGTEWVCDGEGHLTRKRLVSELECGRCRVVGSATEWHNEKGWGSWCRACGIWTFHGDTPVPVCESRQLEVHLIGGTKLLMSASVRDQLVGALSHCQYWDGKAWVGDMAVESVCDCSPIPASQAP